MQLIFWKGMTRNPSADPESGHNNRPDYEARSLEHQTVKKDTLYTFRMNQKVKEALQRAAQRDHRSMASMLDKIVSDFLEKEGFLSATGNDRRRYIRKTISMPVMVTWNTDKMKKFYPGTSINISEGGVLVAFSKETGVPIKPGDKRTPFKLFLGPGVTEDALWFECETRHMADDGTDIRIGAAFRTLSQRHIHELHRQAG